MEENETKILRYGVKVAVQNSEPLCLWGDNEEHQKILFGNITEIMMTLNGFVGDENRHINPRYIIGVEKVYMENSLDLGKNAKVIYVMRDGHKDIWKVI